MVLCIIAVGGKATRDLLLALAAVVALVLCHAENSAKSSTGESRAFSDSLLFAPCFVANVPTWPTT